MSNVLDLDPGSSGSAKGLYPMVYKCKKCRRTLATSHNLMPHVEGEDPNWRDPKWSLPSDEILEGASDLGLKLCSGSLFINPIEWGFRSQLRLYEAMEYHLDPSNVQFKMFKLKLASERMRKAKILFR